MATATLISLEKSLRTSYEPDCDYVDGTLEERSLGEWNHSRLHTALVVYLSGRARKWNAHVHTALRLRVSPTRVRIPDVYLISREDPADPVPSRPPLVCIEVLSPEDRWPRVEKRIEDFPAMVVPHVRVFDPEERQVFHSTSAGRKLVTGETLEVPPISIHLPDLFAEME